MTNTAVTPTCQETKNFASANLVAALETCWTAIRTRHPEIPHAVIVVASGSPSKPGQRMTWGHFAALRWQHGTQRIPEVLVSGEGLSRTPSEVLTTLLHEAAHALAFARGIQDTSRQGRWHNQRFANLATELGLTPTKDPKLGWSPCTMPDPTAKAYRKELNRLTKALQAYRHPEPIHIKQRTNANNGFACTCECGRKIRVSRSVLQAGSILCALCDGPFQPDEPPDDHGTEAGR